MYKNWIFIDNRDNRVLAVKRTREFDLAIHNREISTVQVVAANPLFLKEPWEYVYSLMDGFKRKTLAQDPLEQRRLALLREKVEFLYHLLLNMRLVEEGIENKLTIDLASRLAVEPGNFKVVLDFVESERKVLLAKCEAFFQEFLSHTEAITDPKELERQARELSDNYNIGVYAAPIQKKAAEHGQLD